MSDVQQEEREILNVQVCYDKIQGTFVNGLWQEC